MKNLLVFDLVGQMAHFRKFYTNSSSLSYPFPPRTTIAGILAAILGWERDSYYHELSVEQAGIGLRLMSPVRSLMQTVNYLNTKESRHLDGSGGGTQVPLELILPAELNGLLRYRIFFLPERKELADEIFGLVREQRSICPLYLGLTECPAWIENPKLYHYGEFELFDEPIKEVEVSTVLPVERFEGLIGLRSGIRIMKDRIPLDFDQDRMLKRAVSVIWESRGQSMKMSVKGRVFQTPEESGVLLE